MRSALSVRGAVPAQRRTAGPRPIIRKAKGMNCKDGFHCECPNIDIWWMQRDGDINRPPSAAAAAAVFLLITQEERWMM